MSRLDSFIRRMTAQRDILNQVAEQSLLPESGDILELGLGMAELTVICGKCFRAVEFWYSIVQ